MMTDWYQKSMNTLQLNGKGERTQQAYTRAVRMLSEFYHKTPDELTEEELEGYFLRRRNVDHWSANTMRICYCGIRFFFVHVLQRHWHLFDILRAKSEARLPAILSVAEVRRLLGCVRTPHNRAFLSTVYACGLRLQEALHLEVSDIDSDRLLIHVHRGKGAKDRFVPLPHATLTLLRVHWRRHRHPRLLFPAHGRDGRSAATPMAKSSVQGAFRHAKQAAEIHKRGVSVHTLRHCYATHLLEAGVNLRVIQQHSNRERTMTLPIFEFLRRFLQHVLPRGFMKVRYYGFLSPSSAMPLAEIKARIEMARGFDVPEVEATVAVASPLRCRHCGGVLRFCRVVLPGDSALPALSSRVVDGSAMLTTIAAGP